MIIKLHTFTTVVNFHQRESDSSYTKYNVYQDLPISSCSLNIVGYRVFTAKMPVPSKQKQNSWNHFIGAKF